MILGQLGFGILTVLCLLLVDSIFFPSNTKAEVKGRFRKNFLFVTAAWLIVSGGLSLSGFFLNFSGVPPRLIILILIPLIILIILLRSEKAKKYINEIPAHRIIALQSFRIPVEILLWQLFVSGQLPERMTFEGYNFDIMVGLTAPIISYLIYRNMKSFKVIGIIWNVLGLLLLLNIVIIAILSAPTDFAYFVDQTPNTAVAKFPIVYLPAILVPMAYYLHIISIRQLLRKNG